MPWFKNVVFKCHAYFVANVKMYSLPNPLTWNYASPWLNDMKTFPNMAPISYSFFQSNMNKWHDDIVVNPKMNVLPSPLPWNYTSLDSKTGALFQCGAHIFPGFQSITVKRHAYVVANPKMNCSKMNKSTDIQQLVSLAQRL